MFNRKDYLEKNKEKINQQRKLWRGRNKEKLRAYYQKNRKKLLAQHREWVLSNQEKQREYNRRYKEKWNPIVKAEVLTHYGGGRLACIICRESRVDCLSIDHINNDGAEHRKKGGSRFSGVRFYQWLRKQGYPDEYQTLCMNCQYLKEFARRRSNE